MGWSQDTLSAVADFTTAFGSRGLSGGPAPEQIKNFVVHELPRVTFSYLWTYDLYVPVRNAFDACRSITRASGRGLGLGNQTFLGPEKWHRAVRRVPFGAQKSRDFRLPIRIRLSILMPIHSSASKRFFYSSRPDPDPPKCCRSGSTSRACRLRSETGSEENLYQFGIFTL